jgi:hypothetical protein
MFIAWMHARPRALKFPEWPVGDISEVGKQSQGEVCKIYAHTAVVVKIHMFWDVKFIDS